MVFKNKQKKRNEIFSNEILFLVFFIIKQGSLSFRVGLAVSVIQREGIIHCLKQAREQILASQYIPL